MVHYINMVTISKKTYEKNGIEKKVYNDGISWLNGRLIEQGLNYKNFQEITIKYHSDRKKHRYEQEEERKKQCNHIFIGKK